jgi:hypothetical protein
VLVSGSPFFPTLLQQFIHKLFISNYKPPLTSNENKYNKLKHYLAKYKGSQGTPFLPPFLNTASPAYLTYYFKNMEKLLTSLHNKVNAFKAT